MMPDVDERKKRHAVCEKCDLRSYYARTFDMHFDWVDCWFDCPNDYEHWKAEVQE